MPASNIGYPGHLNQMRKFLSFIAAVLLASVVASIFSSQMVVSGLQAVDVEIDLATRVRMTLQDLPILLPFAALFAVCFLVAFLVAGFGRAKLGGSRPIWFAIGGAAAWPCTLLIMSYVLELMPVAGARTALGLFLQACAGGLGGYLFAKLTTGQTQEASRA